MPGPGAGGGSLKATLTFAKPDSVTDEYGNVTMGWADQFTTYANITAKFGGEAVEAARLAGRQPVIIRVRQYAKERQIATDWKATDVNDGKIYNIRTAIDPHMGDAEHGKWIDMEAEAGVAV